MAVAVSTVENKRGGMPLLVWVFLLSCIVALLVVSREISHAVSKHGEEGNLVSRVCSENAVMRLWVHERKFIDVCEVNGEIGFRVIKMIGGSLTAGNPRWGEVTAYIRNELSTLADVVLYAQQMGYRLEFLK